MSDTPKNTSAVDQKRATAILIVDDDALIRLTLSDHLQDQGFKVLEAATGDEALAITVAAEFSVDIVFTDVMMPGLTDGFALAKWISENQPTIPVIVTSGDETKAAAAKELGADFQFVPKPYVLEELVAEIRHTLEQISTAA